MRWWNEFVQEQSFGSDGISLFAATSGSEAAAALGVDLIATFVGSILCVFHTPSLCVNAVFKIETAWQRYRKNVNNISSYFHSHNKSSQRLAEKQLEKGFNEDFLHQFRHDVSTRWDSKLSAFLCISLSRHQFPKLEGS